VQYVVIDGEGTGKKSSYISTQGRCRRCIVGEYVPIKYEKYDHRVSASFYGAVDINSLTYMLRPELH
jgi:hypothetical protein